MWFGVDVKTVKLSFDVVIFGIFGHFIKKFDTILVTLCLSHATSPLGMKIQQTVTIIFRSKPEKNG